MTESDRGNEAASSDVVAYLGRLSWREAVLRRGCSKRWRTGEHVAGLGRLADRAPGDVTRRHAARVSEGVSAGAEAAQTSGCWWYMYGVCARGGDGRCGCGGPRGGRVNGSQR